jgi:type II secretory pathway pseudopilin PulG
MTLIEVLVSLVLLAVATLGLTQGMVVAYTAGGRSSRRTQMLEFAQSSLERLMAASRKNLCTGSVNFGVVNCSPMGTGTFDPTAGPNQGGWMLDVLDQANSLVSTGGVDLMAGPVVVVGDVGSIDEAATVSVRSALLTQWGAGTAGSGNGCGSSLVTTGMLCREIHIEQQDAKVTGTVAVPVFHVWVRVIRGGAGWRDGIVQVEGVIAQ